MGLVSSVMAPLGMRLPEFTLPTAFGRMVSSDDLSGPVALAFWCNHCPYVNHVRDVFAARATEWQQRGVAVLAVHANDADAYPEDAPDRVRRLAEQRGETFLHLIDASQSVALALGAACTPDFYLFDAAHHLAWRGAFDGSRPGSGVPVSGAWMHEAVEAVIAGRPPEGDQVASVGCSIKWKPGRGATPIGFPSPPIAGLGRGG